MVRTAGQSPRPQVTSKPTAGLALGLLGVLLLLATHVSCVSTGGAAPAVGFVEPPRAELKAKLAQDHIKASDVLVVKLPDGSKATVSQSFQVAPDGTIEVAGKGKIQVAGKTLQQAQEAIQTAVAISGAAEQAVELMLSEYYLVTVDAHGVKNLTRVPIKGEPRVKDAVAPLKPNDKVIWIARPDPGRYLSDQVLPVDWESVAHDTNNRTNYKLQAGDWLFVADEPASGMARVYNAVTGMSSGRPMDPSRVK